MLLILRIFGSTRGTYNMRKTKKEDLRVIRTKKLIFTAFINLIQEKDYNSITVQDISDRAMINRSTFYSHFKDKQDVLDQVFPMP